MQGDFCVLLGVQFLDMFPLIFFTYQKNKFLLSEHTFSFPFMKKSERGKRLSVHGSSTEVPQRGTRKGQAWVLLGEEAGAQGHCEKWLWTHIIRCRQDLHFAKTRLLVGSLKLNALRISKNLSILEKSFYVYILKHMPSACTH